MAITRYKSNGVELLGTTVRRVTGHNAKYIVDNDIGPGTVLQITRSGDVIPYINKVVKATKAQLPNRQEVGSYQWDENKVNFILKDKSSHDDVKIKAWHAFIADGLGIENVGQSTIARLYEAGLDSLPAILEASVDDLMQADGIQRRKAQNIYDSIQSKLEHAILANVAANSGFFGRNVGSKRMAEVDTKLGLRNLSKLPPKEIAYRIAELHGFKVATATPIAENLAKFFKWVDTLPIKFVKPKQVAVTGAKFANQTVVFTGFRSKEWEDFIKSQGGKIGSGVNKDTTLLVAADPTDTKAKAAKARTLRIPIIGKVQFQKKYL